jgi:ribose transport system permease protein
MKKEIGIFSLLAVLCGVTAAMNPRFLSQTNLTNMANVIGLFGVFSIGLGLVIITGGIDLSVGSMCALTGVLLAMALSEWTWGSPRLSGRDIKDTQTLIIKLRDTANPVSTFLWNELSYSQQQDLSASSSKEQATQEVVRALNQIIQTKSIYEKNRFAGISLSSATEAMAKEEARGKKLLQLNRRLIEAAYPQEIAPQKKWPWLAATSLVLIIPMLLGWGHGWLVTRMNMQPFIVTLCGLLLYRGIARFIANDGTKGFAGASGIDSLRFLSSGRLFRITDSLSSRETFAGIPMPFVILVIVAVVMWFVLHRSIYGRYLLAVGRNEQAARFSGINTRLVIASAYIIAGLLTGISGIMIAFYTNSVSPSNHGNFYELYGIAAAVLGGCSLRGGEGSIIGIVIGTALLQVLQNLVNLLGIPSSLNFAVMGAVVLFGVLADTIFQKRSAKKSVQ